jgi:hypothetical protein
MVILILGDWGTLLTGHSSKDVGKFTVVITVRPSSLFSVDLLNRLRISSPSYEPHASEWLGKREAASKIVRVADRIYHQGTYRLNQRSAARPVRRPKRSNCLCWLRSIFACDISAGG